MVLFYKMYLVILSLLIVDVTLSDQHDQPYTIIHAAMIADDVTVEFLIDQGQQDVNQMDKVLLLNIIRALNYFYIVWMLCSCGCVIGF